MQNKQKQMFGELELPEKLERGTRCFGMANISCPIIGILNEVIFPMSVMKTEISRSHRMLMVTII